MQEHLYSFHFYIRQQESLSNDAMYQPVPQQSQMSCFCRFLRMGFLTFLPLFRPFVIFQGAGPGTLQKGYKEVKKSGIPFSKNGKNNSFGIVGVPVGTWPHLRGILVAGYRNGMNKGVPASVRNLQDMLSEISVFIDDEASLQRDLDSLTNELSTRYEELTLIYGVGDKLKVAEDSYSTIRYIINEALYKLHGNASILYVPDLGIIEILLSG